MHTTAARVRKACTALAAIVALTGVAACNSGSGEAARGSKDSDRAGKPLDKALGGLLAALEAVERSTDKAESAKVTGSAEIGPMSMSMNGAMDWSDGLTGALSMVQKGGPLDQVGGDGSMIARYTRDAMYVNLGPEFARQVQGKHWLKYNYEDLAKVSGASGDVLRDQVQNNSPNRSVQMLLASGDVKKVGTESVEGQQTTHYSGTVDVADFTEKSSKSLSKEQLRAFRDQLEKNGLSSERIDLWVNDDNLLVKKTEQATTAQGDFNTTVVYSDYGTEVRVKEPEASDTLDFLEALQQGQ